MKIHFWNRITLAIITILLVTSCSTNVHNLSLQEDNQEEGLQVAKTDAVGSLNPVQSTDPLDANEYTETTDLRNAPYTELPEKNRLIEEAESSITLFSVGDIMVHQEQLDAAYQPETRSYHFNPSFSQVKPILMQADIVMGNLETTLSGSERTYSGYPEFNTPDSLVEALKDAGFTVVTTANNHSLDRRNQGVIRTREVLKQKNILSTGTFTSQEERDTPLLLQQNDIVIAFLSYTYGTNGIPLPKNKPFAVNLYQPQLVKQDIARAKSMGADLVITSLHFGAEYQRLPNEEQKRMARETFEAGSDLIIGHHPHVIQPYEWLIEQKKDGPDRKGFVIYSLGNFISAQRWDYKDVGGILQVVITKKGESTQITQADFLPTYVHFFRKNNKRNYIIYPMEQIVKNHDKLKEMNMTQEVYANVSTMYTHINKHVSSLSAVKP
ncbi:CapA family protein [Brevibacillus daliensis]|uniref:CapA family protein n=1 Tax=Brevibacillus daliensis TaxID=2892995 RepID=UPI001E4A54E2|nr:CapA family protein [Brevibacillus daliensis]